ncbi:MAG TPA: hypothetical protein VFW33_11000 [Gemmataceae bacterium]|nr:hypothetical protein [Gemmataceae bacterium]
MSGHGPNKEPTLAEYVQLVERLEADQSHADVDRLIEDVCALPLQTPEERSLAQSLVARLWRLKVGSTAPPT